MRPPYGAITAAQKTWIKKEFGYPTILWSVDPEDWKKPGSGTVTSRLVSGATPGGILLVHDIHAGTIDAMPATVDQLLAKGFRFVTVTQLIAMEQPGR
jgi:peptidoglycan/xylan/chitin deacetylase (PgdA/CDA1 family)